MISKEPNEYVNVILILGRCYNDIYERMYVETYPDQHARIIERISVKLKVSIEDHDDKSSEMTCNEY